uniref:Uncharacterized protein n=1 Tax=Arundo donax TaxID=35708 RepID=A0A0A8Y8X1_ARUDO
MLIWKPIPLFGCIWSGNGIKPPKE